MKRKTKKSKTYPNPNIVHQKLQTQILKVLFSFQSTRLYEILEDLNQSYFKVFILTLV